VFQYSPFTSFLSSADHHQGVIRKRDMSARSQTSGKNTRKRGTDDDSEIIKGSFKKQKQEAPYAQLCESAVARANVERVRQYYQMDPPFWETSFMSNCIETPLLYSICMDQLNIVKLLIRLGVNINTLSRMGYSALSVSLIRRDIKMTRTLLAARADPNLITNNGTKRAISPLSMAAKIRNTDFTTALLDAKASINQSGQDMDSALINACSCNNLEVAQVLIRAGADVNVQERADTGRGATPLLFAIYLGNTRLVRELIGAGANVAGVVDPDGSMLLDTAVKHGYKSIVIELLQTSAYTALAQEQRLQNSIELAIENQEPSIASLLLQFSCSSTPLFRSMIFGKSPVVYRLTQQQLQTRNGNRGELNLSREEVLHCPYPGQLVLVATVNQVERAPFDATVRSLSRGDHFYSVSFPAEVANLIFSYTRFDWLDIRRCIGC